jgi:hypothetical protein
MGIRSFTCSLILELLNAVQYSNIHMEFQLRSATLRWCLSGVSCQGPWVCVCVYCYIATDQLLQYITRSVQRPASPNPNRHP